MCDIEDLSKVKPELLISSAVCVCVRACARACLCAYTPMSLCACPVVRCRGKLSVTQGVVDDGEITNGSQRRFFCNRGYKLPPGVTSTQCQEDGLWTVESVECTRKSNICATLSLCAIGNVDIYSGQTHFSLHMARTDQQRNKVRAR